MTRTIFLTLLLSIAGAGAASAQHSLEKIWETDTVNFRFPESVLYDAVSSSLYVSCMGPGKIARLGTDGKLIAGDWVTGLHANKGSALYKGFLYTAETSTIAVIDVRNATVIKRIQVEGAVMLNDLAVDAWGNLYTTDTRAGKVYKISGDKATLYLENLPGANGLLTVNSDLYVLTSTSVEKFDSVKTVTHIATGLESGLDGIVMLAENEFIISNYKGILYYLNTDGSRQVLLDSRTNGIMANDISFDSKTSTLFVPSYSTSRITAYKVR